jgi:hypothetical protein
LHFGSQVSENLASDSEFGPSVQAIGQSIQTHRYPRWVSLWCAWQGALYQAPGKRTGRRLSTAIHSAMIAMVETSDEIASMEGGQSDFPT